MDYFTLPELRALPDVDDAAKYSDARCVAAGGWIESIIERECETSFVPREHTETFDGDEVNRDGGVIVLSKPYVIAVTALTQNGTALTADELAEIDLLGGSRFERRAAGTYGQPTAWPSGRRNLVVTYTAGYSETPPEDIKGAALQAARYRLLSVYGRSGLSERTLSTTTDLGTVQLASASENRPTGLPEVDATILGWKKKTGSQPRSATLDYDPQRGSLFHGGRR